MCVMRRAANLMGVVPKWVSELSLEGKASLFEKEGRVAGAIAKEFLSFF